MDATAKIPLEGSSFDIVKNYGQALSDIFSSKFGCAATFDGVDIDKGAHFALQRGPIVVPELRFEVKLPSGVKVSVWKGDLTCFPAEAVVNAANSSLQHGGGLAFALATAGGPQIQRQSDDYINKHGLVNTGEAILLDAGLLNYKKIIHAVGPDLPYNPSYSDVKHAEPLLQKVIWEILERVKESRLKTVAIPAISSGLFHYPLQKCAGTIVSTIKLYYECLSHQDHLPKEIFLVNNDEPTVSEIESACQQIFSSQQPMSYSQATGMNTRGAAKSSPITVEVGNVRMTLKKGNIEEQKVDVIVNTASMCGNLSKGQISFAILKKAGHQMQKEIHKAYPAGHIKVTKPYGLMCREVFHTFCSSKGEPNGSQILWQSVSKCLDMAASQNHKSIAFPAIGTGNLGFDKQEIASMMLHSVVDFSKRRKVKMDVNFVIFPTDRETFQAFEQQIRSLMQNPSHHTSTPAVKERKDIHENRAPTPQIILSGPSEESVAEARKWYYDLFSLRSHACDIYNNFILHFGEEEYYQLSRLMKRGVKELKIEEFFSQGHACIKVQGHSQEDIITAVLEVENMLCKIQKDFVSEEVREIDELCGRKMSCERRIFPQKGHEFKERLHDFGKKLHVVKVDRVENAALKHLFDLKKQQLNCKTSQTMFQRIPAQFCEMISSIGFRTEYAPPENPEYGEGIYFASTVKVARDLWKQKHDEFLYFVEAEVLTGNSCPGKPGLILPPPMSSDPPRSYDSVGGPGISVIFSSYQALPKYIITCINT